jgi:hypothetical protein
MSQVKPRTIRFSDNDWNTIKQLATEWGQTPSGYIHLVLNFDAKKHGREWEGVNKEGRPTKAAKE